VLSIALLLFCQYVYDGKPNSDAEEVLILGMFVLSFPVSFLAGAIGVGVAYLLENVLHTLVRTGRLEMFVVWFLFFMLGYLQWFALIPRVWLRWKNRRAVNARVAR
jgi:putative Mn2+ efflux pump MntP